MLSLLKKINCFENLVTYVGILITNESYTFMKTDSETEEAGSGDSLRSSLIDLHTLLDFAIYSEFNYGQVVQSLNLNFFIYEMGIISTLFHRVLTRLRLNHSFVQPICDSLSAFYLLGSALDVKDRKKENMSLERENTLVTTHGIKKKSCCKPFEESDSFISCVCMF